MFALKKMEMAKFMWLNTTAKTVTRPVIKPMELLETSSDVAGASLEEEEGGSIVLSSIDEMLGKVWDASGHIKDVGKKK